MLINITYLVTCSLSVAQQPIGGAKADGAHIRLRDQGPWSAKHMSRLGGQSNAGPPVFSSQAYFVLNFIDPLKG